MANLLWIDTETTGLGSNAAVIEIAAIAYIDGERKHHFQSYIRPHDGATLDPEAFKINKIDINKIWDFPNAKNVIRDFLDYIDSFECIFSLAGHNSSFDISKLFKLMCRNGEYGSYLNRFNPNNICTFKISKELFKNKRNKPEGFSLKKLCKHYNIELTNAHSALPDIQATIDLYEKLLPEISNIQAKKIESLDYKDMRRKYMDTKYVQINPEGDIFLTREAMNNDIVRRFIFTELDSIYEVSCTDSLQA